MTPFLGFGTYQPLVSNGPAASATTRYTDENLGSDSKKNASLGGLTEDMMKFLYKEGLASDVDAFMNEMSFAIENAYDPISGKPNLAMYKLLLPKLMLIKNEKEAFDAAKQKLLLNNAMDDIAVLPDGSICVIWNEDGNIQRGWLTTDLLISKFGLGFGKNPNLHLVTNGELAKERATSRNAAFNTDITNLLSSATSIDQIANYIKDHVPNLGKYIQDLTLSKQISPDQAKKIGDSVEALATLINGEKEQVKIVSLRGLADLALNYMQNMLPKNMKTLLDIQAAANGQTTASLLAQYIGSRMDEEYHVLSSINNRSGKGKSGSNSEFDITMTPPMLFALGYGPKLKIPIQLRDSTFQLLIPATLGGIPNKGMTLLSDVMASDFGPLFDLQSVSFGGQLINSVHSNELLVDASKLYKVELPVDLLAMSAGYLIPSYEILNKLQELEKTIVNEHITSPQEINELYKKNQLPVEYAVDSLGKRSYRFTGQTAKFVGMSAYAPELVLTEQQRDEIETNKTASIIKDDEAERKKVEGLLKDLYTGENGATSFNGDIHWFWWDDDLFKGMLFMPMSTHWTNQTKSNQLSALPSVTEARDVLEPLELQTQMYEATKNKIKPALF